MDNFFKKYNDQIQLFNFLIIIILIISFIIKANKDKEYILNYKNKASTLYCISYLSTNHTVLIDYTTHYIIKDQCIYYFNHNQENIILCGSFKIEKIK